jgi:hypothetical protein
LLNRICDLNRIVTIHCNSVFNLKKCLFISWTKLGNKIFLIYSLGLSARIPIEPIILEYVSKKLEQVLRLLFGKIITQLMRFTHRSNCTFFMSKPQSAFSFNWCTFYKNEKHGGLIKIKL